MVNSVHTFVVCAYKESVHLQECLSSLKNQTLLSKILIATSTPNEHIKRIAIKNDLEVFETNKPSDIQDDWNFGYSLASTDLVTIAHQDDVYDPNYVQDIVGAYRKDPKSILLITDYLPIDDQSMPKRDWNHKIKKLIKSPLRSRFLSNKRFIKIMILSLGNTICCPSVTYNKTLISGDPFTSDLKFALDWDTFLKFAKSKGRFNYLSKELVHYRIYNDSTTKEFIRDQRRISEDTIMFNKIWPHFITRLIMVFYKHGYNTYKG